MNDTLLTMARSSYKAAKILYKESLLNCTGYHLQLAAELAIRYCLESAGITPGYEVRDITGLLEICRKVGVDCGVTEWIVNNAGTLTMWEKMSSEVGHQVDGEAVKRALIEVDKYILA